MASPESYHLHKSSTGVWISSPPNCKSALIGKNSRNNSISFISSLYCSAIVFVLNYTISFFNMWEVFFQYGWVKKKMLVWSASFFCGKSKFLGTYLSHDAAGNDKNNFYIKIWKMETWKEYGKKKLLVFIIQLLIRPSIIKALHNAFIKHRSKLGN